jgi:hypothetical protein
MDKNNIIESLIKAAISLCETMDFEDCKQCSLFPQCKGNEWISNVLKGFLESVKIGQTDTVIFLSKEQREWMRKIFRLHGKSPSYILSGIDADYSDNRVMDWFQDLYTKLCKER